MTDRIIETGNLKLISAKITCPRHDCPFDNHEIYKASKTSFQVLPCREDCPGVIIVKSAMAVKESKKE